MDLFFVAGIYYVASTPDMIMSHTTVYDEATAPEGVPE